MSVVRKVAIGVVTIVVLVVGAWILRPARASIDGCNCVFRSGTSATVRGELLEVSISGNSSAGFVDDLLGMFPEDTGVQLTAQVLLMPPLRTGVFELEGHSRGNDAFFAPGEGHDARVKKATLSLQAIFGTVGTVEEDVKGTLVLDVVTPTEVRGSIELTAIGELDGCKGRGRLSTPFKIELKSGF